MHASIQNPKALNGDTNKQIIEVLVTICWVEEKGEDVDYRMITDTFLCAGSKRGRSKMKN